VKIKIKKKALDKLKKKVKARKAVPKGSYKRRKRTA